VEVREKNIVYEKKLYIEGGIEVDLMLNCNALSQTFLIAILVKYFIAD
jgi:hypothetical protein